MPVYIYIYISNCIVSHTLIVCYKWQYYTDLVVSSAPVGLKHAYIDVIVLYHIRVKTNHIIQIHKYFLSTFHLFP